jgi:molybdopterin-guanine dinucleotide biosynthesis protein A
MGRPKATLEWNGRTLLGRTCDVLLDAGLAPVVVVAAPDQTLPTLPDAVEVVADLVEGLGPLQGLATGLGALARRADAAFVGATDLPFLRPQLARAVLAPFDGDADLDVVLPVVGGRQQPLAAAYRTRLAERVADLVAAGERRVLAVAEQAPRTLVLDEAYLLADAALRAADPGLDSFANVNTPEEYERARRCRLGP